jgi:hypothetical protein
VFSDWLFFEIYKKFSTSCDMSCCCRIFPPWIFSQFYHHYFSNCHNSFFQFLAAIVFWTISFKMSHVPHLYHVLLFLKFLSGLPFYFLFKFFKCPLNVGACDFCVVFYAIIKFVAFPYIFLCFILSFSNTSSNGNDVTKKSLLLNVKEVTTYSHDKGRLLSIVVTYILFDTGWLTFANSFATSSIWLT